jgi:hypothetical protein
MVKIISNPKLSTQNKIIKLSILHICLELFWQVFMDDVYIRVCASYVFNCGVSIFKIKAKKENK